MPVVTGKDGRILINGSQRGELLDWERTVEETEIENSGQSDAWEYSEHHRNRWSARGRLELPLVGYQTLHAQGLDVGGTPVTVVLKVVSTEGAGFFAGTGRLARDVVRAPEDATASQEVEIRGQGAPSIW